MIKDLTLQPTAPRQAATDLLVVPVTRSQLSLSHIPELGGLNHGALVQEIERRRFQANAGSCVLLPTYSSLSAKNLLLCGLGNDPSLQDWRLLGDQAVLSARAIHAHHFVIDGETLQPEHLQAIVEGLDLGAYEFLKYKSRRDDSPISLTAVIARTALGPDYKRAFEYGRRAAAATCLSRDLINTPAQDATPEFLADTAAAIATRNQLHFEAYDRDAIQRLGMGGLLGVARGASRPPRFIQLTYQPNPHAPHIALVGKGITFDSGGLNLKSATAMEEQKRDMTGAALMLGVMSEIAFFRPAIGVRAYLPCSENSIGPDATKPGDVLRIRGGHTVEVLNTDAEGRLVLADALVYACESKPTAVLDAGTLTAAVRVALGTRVAAILGTDSALIAALKQAGQAAGESLWELPLIDEYAQELRSHVADLRNIGTSGNAGTIICALFLKEFVSCPSWAHLDLSGVAFSKSRLPMAPAGAVGFGVRTLLRYLDHLS
ncbi:MAG TPA: leucyl aminopeptidase [Candidatus Binataceae bacterium]|nr:leucyl aminopeptidase [Candidatus Binataceae bacterium]